jgi:Fe-S-cluster-containing dehydrogenase component
MSRATAAKLGLSTSGERVKLSIAARGLNASLVAPALVVEGHADDCITLPLGYGRSGPGEHVAQGIGVSGYTLRHSDTPYFSTVEVAKADGSHPLVTTQEHWLLPEPPGPRVRPSSGGGEPRWGMAIDLGRCTGCSACVIACQAENNTPVVGKSGVANHREMHWLRVERFSRADGSVVSRPVTCQHCESAPCETVCPTAATTHDAEGLNAMKYERCVGARACANNCPYRVRRFNYLDYQPLLTNAEVRLRERGVMEKCTFCVHRIEQHRADGGPVRAACQQACPTGAIAFGRLDDAASEVARWHADPRAYVLLPEQATRPRVAYLEHERNERKSPLPRRGEGQGEGAE